uniref:Uncharacterized protein n=1 Tax=Globisporangium ultimum (strain ATCC 200006 / CBS 805.95 / DAOM BR144) TaxID=431595 RepID=K3WVG4_GLOUD
MPPLADWAALLRSWCAHLEHSASLSVVRVAAVAGTAADVNNSVLGVNVAITPTDATLSHNSVRLIREAVELLAALAHVDNSAWRFLLQRHCGCSGMPHDDTFLPPRFMVGFGKNWYSATALDTRFFDQFFFGTVRDRNRTDAYAQAMKAIYAKMPVTVRRDFPDRYHRRCRYFISLSFKPPVHMESAERVIAYFKSLRTLVKSIAEASVSYRDGGDREEELDQSISMHDMTFPFENCYMLEGMRLKITRIDVPPRGTALIAELMAQGVEFTPEIDVYQESAFRAITVANNGPILMGIVDSARLSKFLVVERVLPAKAYKFHEVHVDNSAISKETFYYDPDTRRFQALCSALAISQDVDELYLNNLFYNDDYAARSHKWRWLAYALFSNSAFSSPKITSLVLAEYSFRERDMAAIQSVLAARFPG